MESALAPFEPNSRNVRPMGPLVISAYTCCMPLMRDGHPSRAPVCAYGHVPPRHRHCARSDGYLKPRIRSAGQPTPSRSPLTPLNCEKPEISTLVHLGQAFGANDALISIIWGEGHAHRPSGKGSGVRPAYLWHPSCQRQHRTVGLGHYTLVLTASQSIDQDSHAW